MKVNRLMQMAEATANQQKTLRHLAVVVVASPGLDGRWTSLPVTSPRRFGYRRPLHRISRWRRLMKESVKLNS